MAVGDFEIALLNRLSSEARLKDSSSDKTIWGSLLGDKEGRLLSREAIRSLEEVDRFFDVLEQSISLMKAENYEQAEQTVQLSMGLLFHLNALKKIDSLEHIKHSSISRWMLILESFESLFQYHDLTGEDFFRRTKALLYLFRVKCLLEMGDFYSVRYYIHRLPAFFNFQDIEGFLKANFLQILYPKPHKPLVNAICRKYGVKANLIYALMREESHFREDVVSNAGAHGLMQIMPATGREMARLLHGTTDKIPLNLEDQNLFVPEVNIHLGIFYYSRLLAQFKGGKIKALAAYNGGLSNVWRWSKQGEGELEFLTRITFSETRRYIFKVLSAEYYYDQLYGTGS